MTYSEGDGSAMLEGLEAGRSRLIALGVALTLALGMAACGSDDDGDNGGDGGGSQAVAQEDGGGNPKREVEAAYDAFVDDLYDGRWKAACAGYSADYVVNYEKESKPRTCEELSKLEYSTIGVQPRPWVASVEVKGPTRAVGTTKTRADSQGIPIKFVKEDGEWKLDGTAEKQS